MNDKLPIHEGLTQLQEMKSEMFWTTMKWLGALFGIPIVIYLIVCVYQVTYVTVKALFS